jgi:subtilisin family serine protease
MPLRVVPEGDERDKDIALAIIYAVDNGARIINMSFGKQISPNKSFVDDALKYAEIHNVLVIHASGNDGLNIDKSESYPSGKFLNGYIASNWMNVGASNMHADKYLPAKFSNYGQKSVDIFAPGRGIVSLNPSNLYSMHSGTSVATPVVTGVAALLLSYFPELTPQELISILLEGSYKVQKPKKVIIPNLSDASVTKAKFNTLSKSGGIVNAYNAFIIATQRQLERQKNLAKLLTE